MEGGFQAAVSYVSKVSKKPSTSRQLELYGYYKQATVGPCNIPRPGLLSFDGRAKWDAWSKLGDLSPTAAKEAYVQTVCAEWADFDPSDGGREGEGHPAKDTGQRSSQGGGGQVQQPPSDTSATRLETARSAMGPVVSRPAREPSPEAVAPENMSIAQLIVAMDEAGLKRALEADPGAAAAPGDDQMTPLHWASDCGNMAALRLLLAAPGVNVNAQDDEGGTALHTGALCGQVDVVEALLANGADATITDASGSTAFELAADKRTQEAFG